MTPPASHPGAAHTPPPPPTSPALTCNPKAVGRAGARDAEGGGHILLEEGAPLGEVVVPKEVEGVWGVGGDGEAETGGSVGGCWLWRAGLTTHRYPAGPDPAASAAAPHTPGRARPLRAGQSCGGHTDTPGQALPAGGAAGSGARPPLTFAVGVGVGRAEPHQVGPKSRQQLLPGAEGTEGLGQGGALGPGCCPTAPGLLLSHPAPPSGTHRVVRDPAEDDRPGEGEPGGEHRTGLGPNPPSPPGPAPPAPLHPGVCPRFPARGTGACPRPSRSLAPRPSLGTAATRTAAGRGSR